MGGLDWTPQALLSWASFGLCKLPNLPNLVSSGEFHGDGTVELQTLTIVKPPPSLLKKIFFLLFLSFSLSSSFCYCCHQVTMTMMMKTIGIKALCPSLFHVEIIIMSLAMMMIKGWRVSWMPIMLWNSFI